MYLFRKLTFLFIKKIINKKRIHKHLKAFKSKFIYKKYFLIS